MKPAASIVGLALLSASSMASSATVVQDVSFLLDQRGLFGEIVGTGVQRGTLNPFDVSLGTLKSVGVTIQAEAIGTFTYSGSDGRRVVTTGDAVIAGFTGVGCCEQHMMPLPIVEVGPQERVIPGIGAPVLWYASASGTSSVTFTNDFGAYFGSAPIYVGADPLRGFLDIEFYDLSGNYLLTDRRSVGAVRGSATFTYDYAPLTAVPEPATWAMLICGFALVGGVIRVQSSRSIRAGRLPPSH